MSAVPIQLVNMGSASTKSLLGLLEEGRGIKFTFDTAEETAMLPDQALPKQLQSLSSILVRTSHSKEAEVLRDVYTHVELHPDFGGLGIDGSHQTNSEEDAEILFLVSAYLQALTSVERSKKPAALLKERPFGRRGMTLSEKIFAAHDTGRRGFVKAGDVVVVEVDWIMASELSWHGMEKTYNALGKPGIFRNDRFWLAGDHVVEPRIKDVPKVKAMVDSSERARQVFKMTENQGMNFTIMHTEFARERAQPGTLVVGSDSHTCSAGSMGALAIGLGTADVTMPLITGETWFRIPESVSINFIGQPSPGIGGKDIILYILQQLKRNTVAADRVVEFSGPGLKYLSCDARFAIANMCTEFGAVTVRDVVCSVLYTISSFLSWWSSCWFSHIPVKIVWSHSVADTDDRLRVSLSQMRSQRNTSRDARARSTRRAQHISDRTMMRSTQDHIRLTLPGWSPS